MVTRSRMNIGKLIFPKVVAVCYIILFIFILVKIPLVSGESGEWLSIEDEYFIVKYPPGYEGDAKEALRVARIVREITMKKYPHKLPFKVEIMIYPNLPYPAVVYASSTGATIHIRCPSWKGRWGGYEQLGDPFRRVLNHEYVHAVFYYDLYSKPRGYKEVPGWFSQGIAEYISENYLPIYVKRVREILQSGFLIAGHEYALGLFIVEYMYEKFGGEKVISLIKSRAPTFWDAMEETLGITPSEFQKEFIKWIYDKFGIPLPLEYLEEDELVERYKELQQAFTNLEEEHNKLLMNFTDLKVKHEVLRSIYSKLSKKYEKLSADYSKLETTYETLNDTYHNLLAHYKSLNVSYNNLKESYQSLKTMYHRLEVSYSLLMYILAATIVTFVTTIMYLMKNRLKAFVKHVI